MVQDREVVTTVTLCDFQGHSAIVSFFMYNFYPRGACDVRVLAVIVCLSVCVCVCHTRLFYKNI